MDTIIYRKRDRAIGAYVSSRRTERQTREAIATELDNLLISEMGGVTEDYATCDCGSIPPGHLVEIQPDGSPLFKPIPPTRLDELTSKLVEDTATLPDIREILRLKFGL